LDKLIAEKEADKKWRETEGKKPGKWALHCERESLLTRMPTTGVQAILDFLKSVMTPV
jgi:hypothetical protein